MSKPIAVLISDVHYNLQTLKLADAAMRQAINKAAQLGCPLIVAGDLHDTKANLRGECVNAMLKVFDECTTACYILRGNHDQINEKSNEHSINFLALDSRFIIDECESIGDSNEFDIRSMHLIPYHHDPDTLRKYLKNLRKGSTLIMHQGLTSANMEGYIQDKSAINAKDVAGMRVISGHYHTRQTIALPQGGKWDYLGNPYTLGFAEASQPEKGFQILYDDGSLEFVPTNLRKHVIIDVMVGDLDHPDLWQYNLKSDDLIWVKVRGDYEYIASVTRTKVAEWMELAGPFKLDLIPNSSKSQVFTPKNLTQGPLIDSLIDGLENTSEERKTRLKETWKNLV